jgi:hypothetical protein
MNDSDTSVFISLFNEACENCFGFKITRPLAEPDSRHMSNKIFDQTGLVIGAKSIKNYSLFVLSGKDSKRENPSIATLDTLARYVLDAPHTDEINRQQNESDYPYWFRYRSKHTERINRPKIFLENVRRSAFPYFIGLLIVVGFFVGNTIFRKEKYVNFTDNFNSVNADSLYKRGWIVRDVDTNWWNKRAENPGHLTLYTLRGDNWPLGDNPAGIPNLLTRKVETDCFTVEIHLSDFIPVRNWQQAGILLSEDLRFTGKMIRLSISYNDFFGGYTKPPEIIVQAICSSESGSISKPEELAHFTLFSLEPFNKSLVENNLAKSALKIEKKGLHYRFLYTTGPGESFTFKEIASGDFNLRPEFVSIFSIQGWSEQVNIIPAKFDSFHLTGIRCK